MKLAFFYFGQGGKILCFALGLKMIGDVVDDCNQK
jgi:hypothetical protein